MDSIKYKINDNEFGYFIVNLETNTLVDIYNENSESFIEYKEWINEGNRSESWQN